MGSCSFLIQKNINIGLGAEGYKTFGKGKPKFISPTVKSTTYRVSAALWFSCMWNHLGNDKGMEVAWLFPPSPRKAFPQISQYRFFKYMKGRSSIIYPYLAASGCTILERDGFDIEFLDCPTMNLGWNDIERSISNTEFIVLEIRTPIFNHIMRLCDRIKSQNNRITTILYGDHTTALPNEALSNENVDYIVACGDYDVGVAKLVKLLSEGKSPDRYFHFPLKDNLDEIPFVDRDLVPWNLYYEAWRHRKEFGWTMSMRGCNHSCTFCAWVKTMWNGRVRFRSPRNVAEEYEHMHNTYGITEVLDDADNFITKWGVEFAKEMITRGYGREDILWAIQTHPNQITSLEDMKLLRKSGLFTVKLGIESLNQKTLDLIKKGTTVKQIERATKILKEAGIIVHANLMVGYPWETKEDAYDTINKIKELDPNQAQFSLLIPYPNTEIYLQALENNWLLVDPTNWEGFNAIRPILKMADLDSEGIKKLYKDCWAKFYFDKQYIWKHIRSVRHWEGVMQLWKGFESIYFGHMKSMDVE